LRRDEIAERNYAGYDRRLAGEAVRKMATVESLTDGEQLGAERKCSNDSE
jgi:hypothetical protein